MAQLARASFGFLTAVLSLGFAAGCLSQVDSREPTDEDGQAQGQGGGNSGGTTTPCEANTSRSCTTTDNQVGIEWCIDLDGSAGPAWQGCYADSSSQSTPLVLAFDAQPVAFSPGMTGAFDLTGGLESVATDWPTASTPWLAIDRDGNGAIDSGAELFGSASPLSGGDLAPNGFVALRELDSNGDGSITGADAAWSRLQVWSDRDGSRSSSTGELSSVASVGLVSIELDYGTSPRCDLRGNCEVERASFRYVDAGGRERQGAVVDVHLRHQ